MTERPFLLDASAVLAWAYDEIGGKDIGDLLSRSVITDVNLAEVISTAMRLEIRNPEQLAEDLVAAGLEVIPAQFAPVRLAELVRLPKIHFTGDNGEPQRAELSLGDAICIATGEQLGEAVVITGERGWKEFHDRGDLRVVIQLFR
ncbi:type II toxin-antitoxin system VapC family toxin [Streptomyces kaniharaensis]|uniref:Type II toxin-antitoxin system VapC family toxin n=1 Tax=Streptomyces kaniharaensis TaxID=212423 RepID=A0A6N7KTD4_9ACTN|nr:PIN domain-containing protein [Streptomyces kaniharaensis]MQS14701.1 type II toxin-antitoxin system VapC family toxin [Streptomyces kaniharaensis]